MKQHLWQDLAVLILSIILFISILISVRKENQPCQGQTAIAFGAEVCLINPSADPPLTRGLDFKLVDTYTLQGEQRWIVEIDGQMVTLVEVE